MSRPCGAIRIDKSLLLLAVACVLLGTPPVQAQRSLSLTTPTEWEKVTANSTIWPVAQTEWPEYQLVNYSQPEPNVELQDGYDSVCVAAEMLWYVTLSGGVQSREVVHEIGNPATFLTFDDGFAINAALGHRFRLFRAEFEFSHFNNQIETAGAGIPGVGNLVADAVGNVSIKAYSLNGYYDFELASDLWKPYVGVGIGLMQSEINSLFPGFFPQLGAGNSGVNTTSDVKLFYQIRAGMSYAVSCRTELFGGYRYFDAGQLTFAAAPFGVFHPDGATFHSLEAGVRLRF